MAKLTFLLVFFGGGIGSALRYAIQLALHERIVPYAFPWSTFAVNIAGSFLIGLFYALSAKLNLSDEVRLFLTTGLCGGFTTFSTLSNDCLLMIKQGDSLVCLVYVIASIVLGVVACFCGSAIKGIDVV